MICLRGILAAVVSARVAAGEARLDQSSRGMEVARTSVHKNAGPVAQV